MKTTIEIRTQFEGLHHWPDAPDDVAFLRNLHRHLFHVEVVIAVNHHDRETEFFQAKSLIDMALCDIGKRYHSECVFSRYRDLGAMSCEMIAVWIMETLALHMEICRVTVREDDENSATVTR